jgi:hypothetical protein
MAIASRRIEARTAGADGVPKVAAVLADAFIDDPVFTWLLPGSLWRPARLRTMFAAEIERRLEPRLRMDGLTTRAEALSPLCAHAAASCAFRMGHRAVGCCARIGAFAAPSSTVDARRRTSRRVGSGTSGLPRVNRC